ncbi:Energy-coupling factor transporter ATP-binding protein EcfA2 [compost metagenome]
MHNNLIVTGLTAIEQERYVINHLDYQFQAGIVTLIIGRSGSGKTTLLEMISGLRVPSSGNVHIGALPLWIGSPSRRKPNRDALLLLGTAFQHPEEQLFARTIEEEFDYNLNPYKLPAAEKKERIHSALAHTMGQADEWAARDPFALSGGQKRRLTLALLQAVNPDWLLLDEPTAGMDQEGITLLNKQLQERKKAGKGTIIVTHDAEAFLAVADRLVLLNNGRLQWEGTFLELSHQPMVLKDAGLALSNQLETLHVLRQAGWSVPNGWSHASSIAQLMIKEAGEKDLVKLKKKHQEEHQQTNLDSSVSEEQPVSKEQSVAYPASEEQRPSHKSIQRKSPVARMDPRAVWLAYILISSGILIQHHWLGWFASALLTLEVIRFSSVPISKWSKPAIGLIIFAGIASLLSGLTLGTDTSLIETSITVGTVWTLSSGIKFYTGPALITLFQLSRLIMIMIIGFVLLSGLSHLRLKRAIEQGLSPLKSLRVPVDAFALTASLMIRFLPMLAEEWQRFARIAAARGKYAVRPGQVPIRRIRMVAIPFLLSLFRLGERLSLILIVRGVGRVGQKPTIAYRLKLKRSDGLLIGVAACMLVALFLIDKVNS